MEEKRIQFVEMVGSMLSSNEDAHELWVPVVQEYDRGGPDAAREYLDTLAQQLEERVNNLLAKF